MNRVDTAVRVVQAVRRREWHWLRRGFLWPEGSYKIGMLARLQRRYRYPYFIETGTYRGDTPFALRDQFKRLWTSEIYEPLHRAAAARLAPYPNVTCLHQSGRDAIASILPELDGPAIFWLDSHYSGHGTGTDEDPMPVIEELDVIAPYARRFQHVIAIDDTSSYSKAQGTRPLSEVLAKLEAIYPDYQFFFDYDILFALPSETTTPHSFWRDIIHHFAIR